jgi:hypothetical protein
MLDIVLAAYPWLPTLTADELAGDRGQMIDHRRLDTVQDCLGCGGRAQLAFVVEPRPPQLPPPPRWLDCCQSCAATLRDDLAAAELREPWRI